jgi:HipA-like C-terminal domain
VQIKAPMTLAPDGRLSPRTGTPFTHIVKPAGTSGFEALPLVEWVGLTPAREAGFVVPATALIAMPDGMPPALLVERFDIRRLEHGRMALNLNGKDDRLKRADFLAVAAIAGLRPSHTHAAIDDVLERMRAAPLLRSRCPSCRAGGRPARPR